MKRKIVIGVVVLVAFVVGILAGYIIKNGGDEITGEVSRDESLLEDNRLNVVTLSWKPFSYEENGEFKGIGVDLLDEAMRNLNIDYNLILVPWSRALRMAEFGEADAILMATHKEDREEYLMFTDEQLVYGQEDIAPENYLLKLDYVLFINKEDEGILDFESIDKIILDGYTVGVNQDFSYTPTINDAPWKTVTHFDEAVSFEALKNDEMDFFLASREVGLDVLKEMGMSEEIIYIDTPVDSSYVFLLFSKKTDYPDVEELMVMLDSEFSKIHENGKYNEIYNKYI